ncbi:sodium- and chloride-dependent glycine transporter 2-like [Haemaphysalis longicornis]
MSRVSNAHLWLVCFYATLFFMVLNAQCGTVLAVMTPIRDEYAGLLPRRWLWAVVGCLGPMLLALPMMRQDGIYTMKMCEEFMGQLLLPILALLEICFVAHGYGLLRFSHDICFMVKKWPPFLIKFLWKYICPAILSGLCCFNAVLFRKLEIGEHNLPGWTVAVGVLIVLAGLAIVAFFCVYHFYLSEWDCEAALKVSEDWGPRDPDERLRYHAFLKSQGFGRVVSLSEDTAQEAGSQHDSVSLEGNEGGKRSRDASQPSHADSTVPHNPPAGPAVDPVDVPPTSASSPSGSHVAAVPSPKRTLVVSTSGVIVANVPPSETHDQLPDSNHL